ncbi:hypothetical protein DM02DRAFT_716828 [Periconia macrospinosa]|uniref:25S rRNA (uridine-N(3))-methyltransferase BMT5-like domain-containing protein n=1 Tax=Periconia macrospinosa TaxID=97972 RepID=A0A2V1E2P0_9PLEO|nr:hypothetical protein DM02DRAFT_716828 [Periconia macrospinosa]
MSKTKTKRRHRELKRESARKLAVSHRKAAAAASSNKTTNAPAAKKQKPNPQKATSQSTSTPNTSTPSKPKPKPKTYQASQKPPIPFGTHDKILLVGEGDFSFTRSLVLDHGCANVTATSYDSRDEVLAKYPRFAEIEEELTNLTPPVPLHFGVDATRVAGYKNVRPAEEDDAEDSNERKGKGTWDTIAFLFPHTGGLSTDVNRQARANQSLIVSFFSSCLTSPSPPPPPSTKKQHPQQQHLPFLKPGGHILVSLFEGEQYDRWCIRNLARHVGLKCKTSFRFDWEEYPSYRHVRTLGVVEGGGGWKGEEREARLFVFEKEAEEGDESARSSTSRKDASEMRGNR